MRRRRKARDLRSGWTADRPVASEADAKQPSYEVSPVKQYLARFTSVVMVLASLALTLGAGIRWFD